MTSLGKALLSDLVAKMLDTNRITLGQNLKVHFTLKLNCFVFSPDATTF